MAQPKQKKKPRPRSDPARREAAARREEARRRAAEERRLALEAAARRKKALKTLRKVAVPTVVGIGVVVAAIFVFRPQRELSGVAQVDTVTLMAELGYELPAEVDTEALPAPACGVFSEPISSPELLYSDLRSGVVVLWHQPEDQATATALAEMAATHDSHVVVAPNAGITDAVVATSWGRRKAFDAVDDDLAEFVDVYRKRGRAGADCTMPD
jgi:hypothetical protein